MKNEINIIRTSESWIYLAKNKALGYELAENWMFFWTYFIPIALIVNIYSKQDMLIYKGILYIIPIFSMTIIRRNILGTFKYLLANTFVIFLTFIFSFTLIEKEFFLVPIILCFIISIKKRSNKIIEFYDLGKLLNSEICMVICYFIALNYKLTVMMNLIDFASISVAIIHTLYTNIMKTAMLMEWEGEFIKEYSKRMRKIKLACVVFISGVITLFIVLAHSIGLYKLFDILTSKILSFFNGAFTYNNQLTKPQIDIKPDSLFKQTEKLKYTYKPSYLIKILGNILEVIIFAIIFLVIIYLLFRVVIKVINFYKGLNLKKTYIKEEKESVFSLDDIIKEKTEKFKRELELNFNMSNDKKIRKLYHKLIKSCKAKEILAEDSNTPMEIENKVKEVLERNISEATIIYEKARYSNLECSKHEVDKMKSYLKL